MKTKLIICLCLFAVAKSENWDESGQYKINDKTPVWDENGEYKLVSDPAPASEPAKAPSPAPSEHWDENGQYKIDDKIPKYNEAGELEGKAPPKFFYTPNMHYDEGYRMDMAPNWDETGIVRIGYPEFPYPGMSKGLHWDESGQYKLINDAAPLMPMTEFKPSGVHWDKSGQYRLVHDQMPAYPYYRMSPMPYPYYNEPTYYYKQI